MTEETNSTGIKPPPVDRMSLLWQRVNEHKVVQWAIAYVAVAYAIQHAVVLTREAFEWPESLLRVSMLLLALGLPVVVTLAWYHGHRANRHFSKAELSILSVLLVIGAFLFYALAQPSEGGAVAVLAAREASVTAARNASTDPHGAISVAVLPFMNLSSDKEQEFFSDGMTEEITSALAKVPDLRVVARTSAFEFKGKNVNIKSVGEELGATHIIEGSVRRAGNRLRISAQLIKADDGTHIWAEDYDRELNDVFAIQEDIARAITASLRTPLGLQQGKVLVSNRNIDPDTYQDFLRAKALLRGRAGEKPVADAAAILEQVVARNPNFAPAWAMLAAAYDVTPTYHPASFSGAVNELRRVANAAVPKAEAAARRAMQLDPELSDGYGTLGRVQIARGEFLSAESLYAKALSLDANNPDMLHLYSNLLAGVGRLKESLAMKQRLNALEPFVPTFGVNFGQVLWLNGQTDAAIGILKNLRGGPAFVALARAYASAKRYDEAASTVLQIPTENFLPGMTMSEEAARLLRSAPARAAAPQTLLRLGVLGFVYLYIGAPERALEFYEGNVEADFSTAIWTASLWHPSYAPVRKTERFKTLMKKAGLVDYWRAKGWPSQCRPTTGDDFTCE